MSNSENPNSPNSAQPHRLRDVLEAEAARLADIAQGLQDVLEHEAEATRLADVAQARALELLASGDNGHMTINAAVRLADVSVKARRTASQLALARKEREHLREVMAEEQRMMGLRGQQPRPRLRRRES